MRHYLYLLAFAGLMLVLSSGCTKPVTPISFDVKITNNCPGNKLQWDVGYEFIYFAADPYNPPMSMKQYVNGNLGPSGIDIKEISDGADRNGDGALDYGNLDDTPPDTDVLFMALDYLDDDSDDNDVWVASANTIVDGCTVEVTIDENCLASYEIKYPEIDGTLGSSKESGVFQRVERTVLQDIDEDSSR
jgi:hypothetical protein